MDMDCAETLGEWAYAACRYLFVVAYGNLQPQYRTPENADEVVGIVMCELVKMSRGFTVIPKTNRRAWRKLELEEPVVPLRWFAAKLTRWRAWGYGKYDHHMNPEDDFDWDRETLESSLIDEFIRNEKAAIVRHCVSLLPPRHDEIWRCRYFECKSYTGIAKQVGVTRDAVDWSLNGEPNKERMRNCVIQQGLDFTGGDA